MALFATKILKKMFHHSFLKYRRIALAQNSAIIVIWYTAFHFAVTLNMMSE